MLLQLTSPLFSSDSSFFVKIEPLHYSRLYFMISKDPSTFQSYDIFLHEKGQFWPRSDMNSFGQAEVVTLSPNIEIQLEISIKKIENLKTKETNCIEDENYSLTRCFKDFAFTKTKEQSKN